MMKKITMILLVLVLTVMLCACGEDPNPTGSEPVGSTGTQPSVQQTDPSTKPTDNGKATYTVTVVDQNGDPVPGVTLQFCDDNNCKLPTATDANGFVSAVYAPSNYHITVQALPDGYTSEETVFYFGDAFDLTITVTASAE